MIHSVLVTNKDGYLVFSQYFVEMSAEERAEWNQKIFEKSQYDWTLPGEQAMMVDDYVCIFCQVNDARLFIVGDEDELLCMCF